MAPFSFFMYFPLMQPFDNRVPQREGLPQNLIQSLTSTFSMLSGVLSGMILAIVNLVKISMM